MRRRRANRHAPIGWRHGWLVNAVLAVPAAQAVGIAMHCDVVPPVLMQQQMSLFGLSAESFTSPVARVVAPVRGLARMVLAPVSLEPPAAGSYSVIRGLALLESGAVRRLLTTTADIVDGRFLAELTAAGLSDSSTDSETFSDGSEDHGQHSWQAWRTTNRFGFEFAINGVWPPALDAWRRRELQSRGIPTDIAIGTALEANHTIEQ